MNVLLLNPNWREMVKIGRVGINTPSIPLELLYISAALDKNGIENSFVDLWGEDGKIEDIQDDLSKFDFVVLNTSPSYAFWRDGTIDIILPGLIINFLKKINYSLKIIIIGPQGTISPDIFFKFDIDYLIRGEPDLVVADLLSALKSKKSFKLHGVCYKNNGWFISKDYAFIKDMDKLPDLPYSKLDLKHYLYPKPPIEYNVETVAVYEASRGCIYNCSFCFREGFRGKYRSKGLSKIKRELKSLKSLGVGYIYFIDEIFGVGKNTIPICKLLKDLEIKWGCEIRPELLSNDIIDFFADSNCLVVNLGLESADKNVLRNLRKSSIDLDDLKLNVFHMIRKNIMAHFYLIVGSPGETKESLKNTMKYISQFPLDKVNVTVGLMIPYPKTEMWDLAMKEGRSLIEWQNLEDFQGIIGNDFSKDLIRKYYLLFFLSIKNITSRCKLSNDFFNKNYFSFLKYLMRYIVEKLALISIFILPSVFFRIRFIFEFCRRLYYLFY